MKYFISTLLIGIGQFIFGQNPDILLDQRYHHQIDRIDIKNPSGFTTVKPYNRADVIYRTKDTIADPLNNLYLQVDNALFRDTDTISTSKRPLLKHLYQKKPDLLSLRSEDLVIALNPVMDVKIGSKNELQNRLFLNSRGVEVKGMINKKIGFYSLISDNQARFANYVSSRTDSIGAVAGENFWKAYKTNGYDFFAAKGYINFAVTKNIRLKFGYDKNFIGDGYRSMILSDNAGNYTHLKIETQIWKLKYTNIFANMVADYDYGKFGTSGAKNFPTKFMTFHHLSINLRKNLNFGVFESIVIGGDSSGKNAFDINFMNPVIFYRAVESNIGSGGNALLGANGKWNFLSHFSIYAQVVIDEFLLYHLKARDGWWANKYAGQVGLKYIDIANIKGLDAQIEVNAARPFTYSHSLKSSSYSHFNQSLAHPLGANFNEFIGILRYQPHAKLFLVAKYFKIAQGLDKDNENYGSNILLPNTTKYKRPNDIGHVQLQGNQTQTNLVSLQMSYMIKHNAFVEMDLYQRNTSDSKGNSLKENFINLGIRLNLASRLQEF